MSMETAGNMGTSPKAMEDAGDMGMSTKATEAAGDLGMSSFFQKLQLSSWQYRMLSLLTHNLRMVGALTDWHTNPLVASAQNI